MMQVSTKAHTRPRSRWEAVPGMLQEEKLDAMVAASPENVTYTSGHFEFALPYVRERIFATIIPANGPSTYIVMDRAEDVARRNSWIQDIVNVSGKCGISDPGASQRAAGPYSPDAQDITSRLSPPDWGMRHGGIRHLLGTDQLGRDLLARLAYGGRISLLVAAVSVAIAGPLGIVLGLFAGFYGARLESLLMGLVDIFLGIPFILVAILTAALSGPGLINVIVVLGITGWTIFSRVAHARVLSIKTSEFIEGARALGASDLRILCRHVLPHVIGVFIVLSTLQVGRMMIAEAALSFLGLGAGSIQPSWGSMLGASRDYVWSASWTVTFPWLAIV